MQFTDTEEVGWGDLSLRALRLNVIMGHSTLRWPQTKSDGLFVWTHLCKLNLSALYLKLLSCWFHSNNITIQSKIRLVPESSLRSCPPVSESFRVPRRYIPQGLSRVSSKFEGPTWLIAECPLCLWVWPSNMKGTRGQLTVFWCEVALFTLREMWMTSLVFTRVKARRSEARLIFPHRPRVNDKWHFPFVIFGIFVDLFGGLCWIPRNGLWLRPILPISTLHLWNPSTGHFTLIQGSDTCLGGSSRHKESLEWMRKGRLGGFLLVFFFFQWREGGRGWNRCTVGVNPRQLRDLSTWKLLFHINSQAEK